MTKPLPEADTPSRQMVVQDVAKYGWHCMRVLGDARAPGWAYTVGLLHSYDHPEIICFGLSPKTGYGLLNIAAKAIAAGKVYQPDVAYDDFLEGYDCMFKPANPQWHHPFVGYATWFYERADIPVLQLFWPNANDVMPWEPEASRRDRADQPLLFEQSSRRARLGALLRAMRDD